MIFLYFRCFSMCSVFVVHMFSMFFHVCFVVFLVGGVFLYVSMLFHVFFIIFLVRGEQRDIGRWDVPIRVWLVCVVLEKLNVAWPLLMMRKINYPQILIQEFYFILLLYYFIRSYCSMALLYNYIISFCILHSI